MACPVAITPIINSGRGITARVSEAAQPVRKHATGCHNRRQPYNGSAATAGDEHALSEWKGRLLQTLVIPGPNEFSSLAARQQRCTTLLSASNDATVRWQHHVSTRQEAKRFGATAFRHSRSRIKSVRSKTLQE